MKRNKIQITFLLLTIIATIASAISYVYLKDNTDMLGYSAIQLRIYECFDIVNNIIMPIIIAVFVLFNKKNLCMILMMAGLVLRGAYHIYEAIIPEDILYTNIAIAVLYIINAVVLFWYMKDYTKTIIILILVIVIQFILNGNAVHIFDMLTNRYVLTKFGIMNLISLVALSLVYVLPILALNDTKKLKG